MLASGLLDWTQMGVRSLQNPLLFLAVLVASASLAAAPPDPGARDRREIEVLPARGATTRPVERDNGERRLRLASGSIDPLRQRLDFSSARLPERPEGGETDYVVVQFHQGREEGRRRLEAAGVRFFGYVPDGSWQARADAGTRRRLAADPDVRFVGGWLPGFKVSPRLFPRSGDAAAEITLVPFADASAVKLARSLAALFPEVVVTFASDGTVPRRARLAVPLSIREEFLRRAALLEGVAWLEPWDEPHLHNVDSSGPIQGNLPSPDGRVLFARGLTGTGQIVAVADSGCDDDLCFFRTLNGVTAVTDASPTLPPEPGPLFPDRKVTAYWVQPGATAYDNDQRCSGGASTAFHGTHTSGTGVGDSDATPSSPSSPGVDVGDGMAPNAQLLFQDAGDDGSGCLTGLGDVYATLLQALRGGARIHSDSWGSSTHGTYTADDLALDAFLFDHEQMAAFFSAGNDGPASPTTGSPANAKNVVAVGAVGHGTSTDVASYSSRGLTADGRIKPDVAAPGSGIASAAGDPTHGDGGCSVKAMSGTSMSTPTAAGGSALLRQYFSDGYHPTGRRNPLDALEPGGPLIKAVLLNGSLPLGGGTGFGGGDTGWGRVFLANSLFFDGGARRLRAFALANRDGLTTGGSRSFPVQVPAGQEFRATLAWYDAEGTLGASRTLVNDLDLEVTDGITTWRGNAFDDSGFSAPGGPADRKNSVEEVRLAVPAAGTYVVTVRAVSVPGNGRSYTDRQGFALAVTAGSCPSSVTSAPPAPVLSSDAVMGTDISYSPAPGALLTNVYRADGGCAAPASSFQWVGSSTSGSLTDSRAQGGRLYGYRLRGADGCGDGPLSACVEITPEGRCDLVPEFEGIGAAASGNPFCSVTVSWGAGTTLCGSGGLRYNIYRGTSPDFVPNFDSWVATVQGATGWVDAERALPPGTTWFYRVGAEDRDSGGSGFHLGNEAGSGRTAFAAPYGPPGVLGTWRDDAADGVATMAGEDPWSISEGGSTGMTSYLSAVPGHGYPANTCASLASPPLEVGSGAVLSYSARWNLEWLWDGVVVEISGDGGVTWSDLPPNGGYPGTLASTEDPPVNACKLPKTAGAFTGPDGNAAPTAWSRFESPIPASYDGRTIRIRWRLTTDPGSEFEGFFLDAISVTNVKGPTACRAPDRPVVPGDGGLSGLSRKP